MIEARCGVASRSSAEVLSLDPIEKYSAWSGPTVTLFSACAYWPPSSGDLASGSPSAMVR